MQKEVAARILAPPRSGDRGSLSVFLQSVFRIDRVIEAPAHLFLPPPKVDSTVLRFQPEEHPLASEPLFAFIRLGFANPRKTLANVLAAGLKIEREVVLSALSDLSLLPTSRAQELTLESWAALRLRLPGHDQVVGE
jgi:16S rRNA (adenine1518-N6/adenine1519-N6)-dimethyltransferase